MLPAMPSLPLPQQVGADILLEEPHRLGDTEGINFSPPGTGVRTLTFGTPVVTLGSTGTPVSGMSDSSVTAMREGLMLRTYSDTTDKYELSSLDKSNIREMAKKHLVIKVKFVLPDKKYPSFWKPDLLNNTPSYVDKFFEAYGPRFRDRKTNDRVLVDAVNLWKAAAPRFKKDVDNHRAIVAQKMKADVMVGKLLFQEIKIMILLFSFNNEAVVAFIIGLSYLARRNDNAAEEDAEFFKDNPIYDANILDGLATIFQHYVDSDDSEKLAKIRIEDINAFRAFAELCLKHTVGVMAWRGKHRKFRISDFFSVSDEGLALVILENNAKVWQDTAYGLITDESHAKYMQRAKKGEKNKLRKSWSDEGKQRFNEICYQIRGLRSLTLSKTNENDLLELWNQSSRINHNARGRSNHNEDEEEERMQRSSRVYEIFEG